MSYKPFDADTMVEVAATMLQLRIAPEYRKAVKENLKTAAKMAALLEQTKLDDSIEPGPVYRT